MTQGGEDFAGVVFGFDPEVGEGSEGGGSEEGPDFFTGIETRLAELQNQLPSDRGDILETPDGPVFFGVLQNRRRRFSGWGVAKDKSGRLVERPGFGEITDDLEVGAVFEEGIKNRARHLRGGAVGLLDGIQRGWFAKQAQRHLVFLVR